MYLGVVFDRGLSWCKQIKIARDKAIGEYVQLKPFLNNQIKPSFGHSKRKSQLTYALPESSLHAYPQTCTTNSLVRVKRGITIGPR